MFSRFTRLGIPLGLCLLVGLGCTPVNSRVSQPITVAPAAERTICIQTEPAVAETALITNPLKENLASKGYTVVESPDQAAYTMHLNLVAFGLRGSPPSTYSGPVVGSAAGNVLGGAKGGVIGFGVGRLLSGSKSVPFIGKVEVSINAPSSEPQQTVISAWARMYKEHQEPTVRQAVANKLAGKIAALMP